MRLYLTGLPDIGVAMPKSGGVLLIQDLHYADQYQMPTSLLTHRHSPDAGCQMYEYINFNVEQIQWLYGKRNMGLPQK